MTAQASAVPYKSDHLRAIGEPVDMLIDRMYEDMVGYVIADLWFEDEQDYYRTPIGTVFWVSIRIGTGMLDTVQYAVTCRHLIEDIRDDVAGGKCRGMYLRLNDASGKSEDVRVSPEDWVLNTRTDVAVVRITFPPPLKYWAYGGMEWCAPAAYPGRNVFFVGMFSLLPGFETVQAIIRTGVVSRPSVKAPIKLNPNREEITEVDGHLVEARSWGGESGSPVFIYEEHSRLPDISSLPFGSLPRTTPSEVSTHDVRPELLGLLHGHFEINQPVRHGTTEIGGVDVNTGIAVVIPVQDISKTLMDDRLVAERNAIIERHRKKIKPATPDLKS